VLGVDLFIVDPFWLIIFRGTSDLEHRKPLGLPMLTR